MSGLLHIMQASCFCMLLCASSLSFANSSVGQAGLKVSLKYFPVGPIYEYRWKLLDLALAHTRDEANVRLEAFAEEVTQNRGISLLQSGAIDVIALGTNAEREAQMLPVKIDILRGIIGYRVLVIRKSDQAGIAIMDEQALRQQLTFGLNSQWADLPILRANGFTVVTSTNYENLFGMLAAGRFDAFTRGLNEAYLEIEKHKEQFPQLMTEKSKALYFPYPVYFWVNKDNQLLASRIERGLKLALADGSFRQLFESYHAKEIKQLASEKRQLIRLSNPVLPTGTVEPDTRWWWH
ncbi:MAG: transporter substrate-binding domain-containing protein [Pseudomonadota bacterium]